MKYPITEKTEETDIYFGTQIKDPYRWLENDTSPETANWVRQQNEVTFGYLEKIPFRELIKKRIQSIIDYERIGMPSKEGADLYFSKNDGLQNHNVIYRKRNGNAEPEVFLDPNTFSEDGTTGLDGMYFTKDGTLLTYLIIEGGSDWRKAITINVNDEKVLLDTLKDLKFTGISWLGKTGFFYSSYDKPEGSELSARTQNHKLLFHKLGTPQAKDELIFGGENIQRRYISGGVTEDERFLVITAANSTTGNELYIKDLRRESELVTIVNNFENNHYVIDNNEDHLLIFTNYQAPNGKVIGVSANNPYVENWKDIVPESEYTIESISIAGLNIFVNYLKDASTLVKQFDYQGRLIRNIQLPEIGTAAGFSGKHDEKEVYYSFTSFTYPTSIFRFDINSGKSVIYQKPKVVFDPEDFETKQVFYPGKDGTRIPMFIVHKKGLELNGRNPTILYGYGGFSVSLTPGFSPSRIAWLENGGIYAQPSLRGGGEYGESWHLEGTKMKKQNVFDDFIAAAEFLFAENYTSSPYLALAGGSNGGLLVGATMTQRPGLAKVALPDVGVLDMLRYHKFTAGAGWAYDYGTAEESKEMFEYLLSYSPLHALKQNTAYPATMTTTADHDDRVVPAHSFKFAAALQEAHTGENPVLIRIDVKSGHGASNLTKAIEKIADQYSFAWHNMGLVPPLEKMKM